MVRASAFNQTAYRIIRLVEWLADKPRSHTDIHELFQSDPNIGKTVSQDSLGIYMNTLRAIGCDIDRPKPSNNHCYVLNSHPFSYHLSPDHIQLLSELAFDNQNGLTYRELLRFYSWLSNVFQYANNDDKDELRDQFFVELRFTDFLALEPLIDKLESHIYEENVLWLTYESANRSAIDRMIFLPEKLFHLNGGFYVQGQSPEFDSATMLRLDKISHIELNDNTSLRQSLMQRKLANQHSIQVRLLNTSKNHCSLKPWSDYIEDDPNTPQHVIVEFNTDNWFLIKQQLLESGYDFHILKPKAFQDDMADFLLATKAVYAL